MSPSAARAEQWIRRYRPASEGSPVLVCFPHAGGSATYYLPVAAALAPAVDVAAIQYPGRQERRHDACIDDIPELSRQIRAALAAARLSGSGQPIAFFGHSMGALVAFEVASLMRLEQDAAPAVLFASGRRAPSCRRTETLHLLGDAALVDEMGALGGTDSRILRDQELLSVLLPAIRSDYRAAAGYWRSASTKIDAPIVALTGDSDPYATREEADAWRRHTTGDFELHTFPGGHFYLEEQQAEALKVITGFLGSAPRA